MGYQNAAQGTQQAMLMQALMAQQQQQSIQGNYQQGIDALMAAQGGALGRLSDAQKNAIASLRNNLTGGITDLQRAQTGGVNALRAGQQQGIGALQAGQRQGIGALDQAYGRGAGALSDYYGRGVGFQQPYMDAGAGATNRLAALYGAGGEYATGPSMSQLQMDPGYAFRQQEGERAMQSAAGAGGLRGSGAALKAATRYGQEASSQEYQNAYNRAMANRAAATQGLQGLMQGGLSASNVASGLAGQTGTNLANLAGQIGSGKANIYGQTGTNMANLYGQTGSNLANLYGQMGTNMANLRGQAGANMANIYSGLGGQMANAYLGTGANLANLLQGRGQQLSNIQGNLGQGLGQGLSNLGNIYAQQRMAPWNALSSLGGQAAQAAMMAYGGGGFKNLFGSPFPMGRGGYNAAMGYMDF